MSAIDPRDFGTYQEQERVLSKAQVDRNTHANEDNIVEVACASYCIHPASELRPNVPFASGGTFNSLADHIAGQVHHPELQLSILMTTWINNNSYLPSPLYIYCAIDFSLIPLADPRHV